MSADTKSVDNPIFEYNYDLPRVMSNERCNIDYTVYRVATEGFISFHRYNCDTKQLTESQFEKTYSENGYCYISASPTAQSFHKYKLHILLVSDIKIKTYETQSKFDYIKKLAPGYKSESTDKLIVLYYVTAAKKTNYYKLYNNYRPKNIIVMKMQDFYLIKPLKFDSPKYSLITQDISQFLIDNNTKYTLNSLSVLHDSDPMMLWLLTEQGMVVRIARPNPATAFTYEYKSIIHKQLVDKK
jgi:hypothetical protein